MKIPWIEERKGLWGLVSTLIAIIALITFQVDFVGDEPANHTATVRTSEGVENHERVSNHEEPPLAPQTGNSTIKQNSEMDYSFDTSRPKQAAPDKKVMRWGDEWGKGILVH